VDDAGFVNMQVEHVQLAPPVAAGLFIPALDQSKDFTGAATGLSTDCFRGAQKSKVGSESVGADLASTLAAGGGSMGLLSYGKV